jgi:hypothetical protein
MKLDVILNARSKILQRGSFDKNRSREYANNLLMMQKNWYDFIFMMFFSSHFGDFMIFYIIQTIFILFLRSTWETFELRFYYNIVYTRFQVTIMEGYNKIKTIFN